jgi:transcriptional regulator with XRE-family HTH domain
MNQNKKMSDRGKLIKQMRLDKGLTQDELCEAIWNNPPFRDHRKRIYWRWENGEHKYTHSTVLDDLARFYKIDRKVFDI